ncbi:hypothetical protein Tco_0359316 [Tanacetum coccineum]
MRWKGKDFPGEVTPLLPSVLASQVVEGEPIPIVASSSPPKKTHKHRKTKRKATKIILIKWTTTLVADETVHEKREDRMERATTTTSSLEAKQDRTGSETRGKYGHDIEINTTSTSITTASINITTIEPVTTDCALITTTGVTISTSKPSTPPTTTTLIEDEDLIIAQTLMKMRSELFVELMDKRKRHFAKLRAEEQRRKPPIKTQKRNQMSTYLRNMAGYQHTQLKSKSYDEIQKLFDKEMKRMNTFVAMDSEVVEGCGKNLRSSGKKAESSKKRTRAALDDETIKRQKVEDDAEKAELKAF